MSKKLKIFDISKEYVDSIDISVNKEFTGMKGFSPKI